MNCAICKKSLLRVINSQSIKVFTTVKIGDDAYNVCGSCERVAIWLLERLEEQKKNAPTDK